MRSRIGFGWALGIVALASALASGGAGADSPQRSHVGRVTVRIVFTNNGADVTNGALAGRGYFTAAGAISDKGSTAIYRTKKGSLITLRYVTVGKKGSITFMVKIDTTIGRSRWTIASGTRAYKGLHGKGTERENATYTVSTLIGTVWR